MHRVCAKSVGFAPAKGKSIKESEWLTTEQNKSKDEELKPTPFQYPTPQRQVLQ
jgi:hypothetical protein